MTFLLLLGLAHGKPDSSVESHSIFTSETRLNFRMGVSSATTNGQPTICLEGSPFKGLYLETCGTGAGFVHTESGAELVHFRGKWNVFQNREGSSVFRGQLGVGFAELQLSDDQLGFKFSGVGMGIETAGPEASGSIQYVRFLGSLAQFILDANFGAAYFHYAPELSIPQNRFFPFWEVSLGLGW